MPRLRPRASFVWPQALIVALLAALWASVALAAANFPPLTGRVVDQANILSPVTKADLERKLADLEQKSRIQLVVATVPSLDGEEIEPYANGLFRAWKLGEAKDNNGALLLIAPKERRVRIEVGYGLEGTLTDAVSSIIIANAIAPRFKAGDFNGGVTRGVDDIITTLSTNSAEWKPKPADMRAEHEASLLDTLAPFLIFLFIMFVISRMSRRSGGGNVIFIPMGTGGFGGGFRGGGGFGGGGDWRRGRIFRRRRVFRRRRRLGRLVMILDPEAAARVEAAYDAAQLETRAPLVCVLAGASTSLDGEFLLGACILALATPLPLLLFTNLSAHRIYVAQLLVAILAAVLVSLPPVRRWLIPKRVARSAGHRAALAQFVLRGIDRSRCGALIYVSLAEHYIRIVPAEDAARLVPQAQWQAAVDEALGPLAAGETEAALTGLAASCGDILAAHFPPGPPVDPAKQRFHIV